MTAFSFGGVFNRFFKIIGDNFLLFLILGLVAYVLPAAVINFGLLTFAGVTQIDWPQKVQGMAPVYWLWIGGAGVLLAAIQLFNLAAITEVAILRAVGKPVTAGRVISDALGNMIPILVISLMVGLCSLLGFILLIVPGFMFMVAAYVAIPARVAEPGLGMWGSVQRSFDLTRNHRWMIFLLVVVFGLLIGAVSSAVTMMIAQFGTAGTLPFTMAQVIVSGIRNILGNVLVVAIYVCLRESKDKATPAETADVFA